MNKSFKYKDKSRVGQTYRFFWSKTQISQTNFLKT